MIGRLLIVGASEESALETSYAEAFRSAGVETTVFDPNRMIFGRSSRVFTRLTWSLQHLAVSAALRRYIASAPAVDAVLVFKGYFLNQPSIAWCRTHTRVPWLNFNPDSPFDPGRSTSSPQIRAALSDYDLYATWSTALVPKLLAYGARRAEFLPFAAAPEVHYPDSQRDPELRDKLTFVGSHDAQRASTLSALAGLPLAIYGNAWEDLPRRSPLRAHVRSAAVHGAGLRRVVSSSLASINILRPQNVGSHNMRTFEVPAMGGLLLTTRSQEQQGFFPDQEASLMYGSPDELRSLAERLLRGEYDVPALKANALARAATHTYHARALTLLGWIDELKR